MGLETRTCKGNCATVFEMDRRMGHALALEVLFTGIHF